MSRFKPWLPAPKTGELNGILMGMHDVSFEGIDWSNAMDNYNGYNRIHLC